MTNNNQKLVYKGGWDQLENAVYTGNKSLQLGVPTSFVMRPDGTQIFVLDGGDVDTYNLAIPHDVESHGSIISSFTVSGNPFGIDMKDDGTRLYTFGMSSGEIHQYNIPTPWNLSSIVDSPEILPTGITNSHEGTLSRDGDFMFIVTPTSIFRLPLPIPWDITSNTSNTEFIPGGNVQSVKFKREGDIMYLLRETPKEIEEYTLSTIWDPQSGITTGDILDLTGLGFLSDFHFKSNGNELFLLTGSVTNSLIKYHMDKSWSILSASHFSNAESLPFTNMHDFAWKPDGTKFLVLDIDTSVITEFTVPHPWNQRDAIQGASFSLAGIQDRPTSIWVHPDGKSCFIIGLDFGDRINRLDMTSAWDISTMSDPDIDFVEPIEDLGFPHGMYFKPGGMRFYLSARSPDMLYEYSMPTPFDIENAALVDSIDITSFAPSPHDISFKLDGGMVFVVSDTLNAVTRFVLSIPWDITSIVFVDSLDVSAQETTPRGIFIRHDTGMKLYLIGANNTIFSFDMSLEFNNSIISPEGIEVISPEGIRVVAA